MRYLPCWKQIGISQDRYRELLHFCRQYPEWKTEANSLLGIRAIKADGLPHGSGKSDPVARAAERRERLLAKISIVEGCAKASDDGAWFTVLIDHVCRKTAWKDLKREELPTSDANTFYRRRREFFDLLNKVTDI